MGHCARLCQQAMVMPLSCASATYSKSEGEERSQNRLSEMLSRTLIKLEAIHYYDERHSC
jgi:hypothetical protein